jgi:hypothetical protein
MEKLDGVGGETGVELVFDQRIGHRVIMAIDFHVVIDVNPYEFPLGVFIGGFRERSEGWAIEGLKQALP